MNSPNPLHILAIVASSACWGGATTLTKMGLDSWSPLSLLVVQLLASNIFLWGCVKAWGLHIEIDRGAIRYALLGIFEPGLAYLFSLMGLQYITASSASLIFASEPILVFLLALLFLHERLTRRQLALGAMTLFGVALTSTESSSSTVGADHGLGIFLVFLGTACAAVYVICARNCAKSNDPLLMAAMQQLCGLLFVVAVWSLSDVPLLPEHASDHDRTQLLVLAAFSGIVQYALSLWCYLLALKGLNACAATVFLSLIPIFGVLTATTILQEPLSAPQWCGVALTVSGVALFARASHEDASPTARAS